MIRGSTPTHEFTLEIDTKDIVALEIAYAQNDKVLFIKSKEDCVLDGNTIKVDLSQEETLKFDCYKRYVQIQMRYKTVGAKVPISHILIEELEKCLFDGVI